MLSLKNLLEEANVMLLTVNDAGSFHQLESEQKTKLQRLLRDLVERLLRDAREADLLDAIVITYMKTSLHMALCRHSMAEDEYKRLLDDPNDILEIISKLDSGLLAFFTNLGTKELETTLAGVFVQVLRFQKQAFITRHDSSVGVIYLGKVLSDMMPLDRRPLLQQHW